MTIKKLELLAPAKNLAYGMEAVKHGADSVYIGAPKFGARSAASNSLKDIEKLCEYAHIYRARVYAAFNTIIFENELEEAEKLIHGLWNAGVDVLIVQDMGILEMNLPPIPLFASTQTDNRSPEKVKFLEDAGFRRVILARELSLDDMRKISSATSVELEAFVHGALCVSYSGRCYLSASIGRRSANRGECGQPCRLPWNLLDEDGNVINSGKHLLCLKDMNRSDHLMKLVDAGVTSFKIEGRLKDLSYLRNITAFYRKKLDEIIDAREDLERASSGKVFFGFTPDPDKTFNRGYTDYFLNGKRTSIHSFATPKSVGEKVGKVKSKGESFITAELYEKLNNGDGLSFFDDSGRLHGFRANRVEKGGKIFPAGRDILKGSLISKGMSIFRNSDHEYLKQLDSGSVSRKIGVHLYFSETKDGFILKAVDEDSNIAEEKLSIPKEAAENKEAAFKTISLQLQKFGNTIFYVEGLDVNSGPYFIQKSRLNDLRRRVTDKLESFRSNYAREEFLLEKNSVPYPESEAGYSENIANSLAVKFHKRHGVKKIEPAFETGSGGGDKAPVMITKYCIRHALGICLKEGHKNIRLYLENDKARLRLDFDCKNCEMVIFHEDQCR